MPFVVTFEDSEDKELPEKLRQSLPGILAWAVRGCLEWQKVGLAPPEKVQTVTKEYQAESDELAPFLEARCVLGPNEKMTAKELRATYLKWCELEGEQPLSAKAVGSRLTELGCKAGKGTPRTWRGIGLAPEHTADPDEDVPPPGRGDAWEPN